MGLENGKDSQIIRFIPIRRLNAIVVVSSQPSYLEEAKLWIRATLMTQLMALKERVFFYSVQNGRASEIADILGGIFEIKNTKIHQKIKKDQTRNIVAPGNSAIEFSTVDSQSGETYDEDELLYLRR